MCPLAVGSKMIRLRRLRAALACCATALTLCRRRARDERGDLQERRCAQRGNLGGNHTISRALERK